MEIFLLTLVVFTVSLQNIVKKAFGARHSANAVFSFAMGSVLAAAAVFLVTAGGELHFTFDTVGYSLLFATAYGISTVGSFLAIATGPLSVSSLLIQLSLIIPTLYGILFRHEELTPLRILGIFCLLLAIVFVNLQSKKEEKRITLKWVVFITLAFFGNGFCSVSQQLQQDVFEGQYKSEFMIVALLMVAAFMLIPAIFTEKKELGRNLVKGLPFFLICGVANGVTNYAVLLLNGMMPASVMFPVISAGGILLTAVIALTLYKEKLSPSQIVGFVLGLVSVVTLNL